jgi:hypothetical protein
MITKLPSVPTVPSNIDPQLAHVLNALKANIEAIHSGSATLPYVTPAQLTAAVGDAASLLKDEPDTTPPIALDNLEVVGGVLFNMLTWGVLPGNIDHIKIYRAATNNRTLATAIGTTQYTIWADYIPEGVNTKYYYWLRAVSKAGVLGSWNLVKGHISTAGTSATPLGIGDEQVGTISASKIYCLTLAALSANLGVVTAGRMWSGDKMFDVNLTDKYIIIGSGTAKPAGVTGTWYGSRYINISSGNITNYEWNGKAYVESKSLRVIEVGTAANNSTVVLSKYYKTQPQIIVSPDSIQCYSASYKDFDQTLQIAPKNIKEVVAGSGKWQFQIVAQLVKASGSVTGTPNWSSGTQANAGIQSGTYTTPPSTTRIEVGCTFVSARGTGTAPNYYYRAVTFSMYARASGSSAAFGILATKTFSVGATVEYVSATLDGALGYAAAWDFYVVATFSDLNGTTFAYGAGGFNYAPDVVLRLAADTAITSITSTDATVRTASPSFTLPAFTPTAGYSVYEVNYSASYGAYLSAVTTGSDGLAQARASIGGLVNASAIASGSNISDVKGNVNVPQGTITASNSSYSPVVSGFAPMSVSGLVNFGVQVGTGIAQFKIFAAGTQAVIKQRQAIGNSATPSNSLSLIWHRSTMATSQTLANGTLNYTAIL